MSSDPKDRKSHLLKIDQVLQSLLQNNKSALAQGFTRWRLEQQWPQVVGEKLAQNTLPCSFEKGILYVWVSHPAWMQQLYFFKDQIKEKVNQHLGANLVQDVRLTLDKRAAKG